MFWVQRFRGAWGICYFVVLIGIFSCGVLSAEEGPTCRSAIEEATLRSFIKKEDTLSVAKLMQRLKDYQNEAAKVFHLDRDIYPDRDADADRDAHHRLKEGLSEAMEAIDKAITLTRASIVLVNDELRPKLADELSPKSRDEYIRMYVKGMQLYLEILIRYKDALDKGDLALANEERLSISQVMTEYHRSLSPQKWQ